MARTSGVNQDGSCAQGRNGQPKTSYSAALQAARHPPPYLAGTRPAGEHRRSSPIRTPPPPTTLLSRPPLWRLAGDLPEHRLAHRSAADLAVPEDAVQPAFGTPPRRSTTGPRRGRRRTRRTLGKRGPRPPHTRGKRTARRRPPRRRPRPTRRTCPTGRCTARPPDARPRHRQPEPVAPTGARQRQEHGGRVRLLGRGVVGQELSQASRHRVTSAAAYTRASSSR